MTPSKTSEVTKPSIWLNRCMQRIRPICWNACRAHSATPGRRSGPGTRSGNVHPSRRRGPRKYRQCSSCDGYLRTRKRRFVDFIECLETSDRQDILDAISEQERVLLEDSLSYPEDSASRLMRRGRRIFRPIGWSVKRLTTCVRMPRCRTFLLVDGCGTDT